MSTVVARSVTKAVVPLIVVVALSFFFQGHNLPGGGFIAGVMTAAAIALVYIIFDFEDFSYLFGIENKTYRAIREYIPLTGAGLALAVGSGVLSVGLGASFLDHSFGTIHIPLIGEAHWTTALIFDLGVYMTVTSSILVVIEVVGEE
ncbi:MnhB domain-containing protein [Candidatus Nanohalococcus occultus]|uniref:Multicomponent Na:H antiporter subunit B n=1 Tax=Candidatus Nanohalococcus occultus TaxID=2978047 RepID=A0ABY8CIN1_9ARCH|nr:Multicomponent Na :H antiporter subunit B [Candidatus Nanohaloarchaeota archaeon SVXNc]